MNKSNNLDDIFTLLDSDEGSPSPDHFIFLLGTDTHFTPKPTGKDGYYPNGETLSYTAQLIAKHIDGFQIKHREDNAGSAAEANVDEINAQNAIVAVNDQLSFSTESVDLLMGVDTWGQEVGKRIAQTVFLALRAAAHGKKTLQITGHSRGAVEAILVTHELERIKNALQESPEISLFQILSNSPGKHTKAAMKTFFQEAKNETLKGRCLLLEKLSNLKINPFLIDPVPGDSRISLINWSDNRFYDTFPCTNHKLLICRDERSQYFRPIIPSNATPEVIPGYHGTPSGSLTTHTGGPVKVNDDLGDVSGTQKLVLCQLLQFYNQSTNLFSNAVNDKFDLDHPELDRVVNEYLQSDIKQRDAIILSHYSQISKNDPFYRALTASNYSYAGSEHINNHRIVHYRNQPVSFAQFHPEMQGEFISVNHASLYIRAHFAVPDLENELPECIVARITGNILNTINAVRNRNDKYLLDILSNKKTQQLFLDSFTLLIDAISQKYLRNNITDVAEKYLINTIQSPFDSLNEILENKQLSKEHIGVFITLKEKLENSLKDTIENYSKMILEQSRMILAEIRVSLQSNPELLEQKEEKSEEDNSDAPEIFSIEQRLQNIEQLFDASTRLMLSPEKLNPLLGEKKQLKLDKQRLELNCNELISTAGKLLYEATHDWQEKPESLSELFFNTIKKEAEKLNAPENAAIADKPASEEVLKQNITLTQARQTVAERGELFFNQSHGRRHIHNTQNLLPDEPPVPNL